MKRIKKSTNSTGYQIRQPCFGFFLQGAVKSLAIADGAIQIGMTLCFTTGVMSSLTEWGSKDKKEDGSHHIPKMIARFFTWFYIYFHHIVNLSRTKTLYQIAEKRDRKRLRRWLIFSIIMFIPYVINYLTYTIWVVWLHAHGAAVFGGYIIYKSYSFWVIFCYISEIKYYGGFNSALRELSDEEIEGFFHGQPSIPPGNYTNVKDQPYRSDFEIPIKRIKLEERSPLGCGAFGTVLKATLLAEKGDPFAESGWTTVAVKMLSRDAHVCYFKALLLELKILSYVGRHENVVNLLGACTSMLKDRQIYIVVEFCKLGCITNYLKANRGTFIASYNGTSGSSDCKPPCLLDLVKWSSQTASGMEYLSSKKIIHGDLAGRNVLLTGDKIAKIADFGLSRQLYHYSTYIKQNDEPLPWRWMSPESLCDLKFSTASDVWSFGVTMWEFFTLGETPYCGYGYTTEFVKELKSGRLRLNKPPYAENEIFRVMQNCWKSDAKDRPSFKDIKTQLEQILVLCSQSEVKATFLSEYIIAMPCRF